MVFILTKSSTAFISQRRCSDMHAKWRETTTTRKKFSFLTHEIIISNFRWFYPINVFSLFINIFSVYFFFLLQCYCGYTDENSPFLLRHLFICYCAKQDGRRREAKKKVVIHLVNENTFAGQMKISRIRNWYS